LGGIRYGPALAGTLYLLLVVSAALALWARRTPSGLPTPLGMAAPWIFLVFVVAFALYRLGLVRAGRYPAFKAFFQVGAGVLFFTLLLPGAQSRYIPESDLEALLHDANPRVRAMAAEVARHRPEGKQHASLLVRALQDPDPAVRTQAHLSLVAMTGQDLGAPGDANAMKAWRERYP
jgi:hypothetical protein